MQNDMTKGSPLRLIVLFTLPVLIGNLFQNFYNMVDSVIVGRFLGVNALAAVGATGTIGVSDIWLDQWNYGRVWHYAGPEFWSRG